MYNLKILVPVFAVLCQSSVHASGAEASGASSESRPDILWITCEDMSPDLGCYGDTQVWTPNIDRLAEQGAKYTRAFTVAPVCAPNRSALITGAFPTEIGTHHMRSKVVPPPEVKCFTEYMRAAGYYCTNNSKTDYNFDSPRTAWDQSGARAHWRNRPKGMPFFSVVNLTETHESKMHADDEEFERVVSAVPAERRHRPEEVTLPPYYPDTPIVRKDWARYLDTISAMDIRVGEILAELEADGLSTSTIVFFFSDHGRGLPRAKRWVYDSGIHAPLVVRWPGVLAAGSVNEELVSFVDFAPTVLSLAGAPRRPPVMRGRVFLGDEKAPAPEFVFAARDRMIEAPDMIRAVRDERYKYIRNFEPERPYAQVIAYLEKTPTMQEMRRMHADGALTGSQALYFRPTKPEEELYDTLNDPHEIDDLAGSPELAPVLQRMRAALKEWQDETGDLGRVPEEEMMERMRPGGEYATTAAPVVHQDKGASSSATTVTLASSTEGASIAYRFNRGTGQTRWLLYSSPLRIDRPTTVTAVACRLGYLESNEVVTPINAPTSALPAD